MEERDDRETVHVTFHPPHRDRPLDASYDVLESPPAGRRRASEDGSAGTGTPNAKEERNG